MGGFDGGLAHRVQAVFGERVGYLLCLVDIVGAGLEECGVGLEILHNFRRHSRVCVFYIC